MEDVYALSDVQIKTKIGEKIKATRLKQNITQDSLAESASISRSSVQKVESGEIKSFDTFLRILRTLGMLDELHHLCEEEQLSPSEYYDMVNSIKRNRRKRARKLVAINICKSKKPNVCLGIRTDNVDDIKRRI